LWQKRVNLYQSVRQDKDTWFDCLAQVMT